MKNPLLDRIIGCRIRTHYNTGGIVESYSGPHDMYGPGSWTVVYRDQRDNGKCWINSIKAEGMTITCEGQPLEIFECERDTQLSLF